MDKVDRQTSWIRDLVPTQL